MRVVIGVLIGAVLASAPSRGDVRALYPLTCPESKFTFDCSVCPSVTSTTPTGTVLNLSTCTVLPWQSGQPCPNACYDLQHGRVEAHRSVITGGHTRCDNAVGARDTLRLAGPDGPALSFEAVLLVQCTIVDGGSAVAALLSPGGPFRQYSASVNEELVLPLSVAPGGSFEIYVGLSASNASPCCVSGSGGADITADLRFRGLPADYWLVSCSGANAPVPASVATWGGVKALYR